MNFIKSVSVYTLSNILNKAVGFLLLPVFTYYLTPDDYGTLSLINTIIMVVTPFILLQSRGAISVEYYKLEDKKLFQSYFKSALFNPFISFAIFTVLFLFLHRLLANWFAVSPFWMLLVPLFALVQLIPFTSQTIFQVSERPVSYGIYNIAKTIFNLSFSLLLVVTFGLNYEGRLWGILLTGVVFSGVSIYLLQKENLFAGKIRKQYQKDALAFGLPLIPHAIGVIVINSSDRLFIAKMVSVEELGIYSIGYAIGSIIMIIEHSFTQAWIPFLFKKLKENTIEAKKKIVLVSYVFMLFLIGCTIVLTLIAPLLFDYVFESSYQSGVIYVFWVALGYTFLGFYKVFTGYISFFKRTDILGKLSIVNVLLNLGLNYYMILHYGAIGAAYATAISFFIFFIFVMLIADKLIQLPWFFFLKRT